MHRIDSNGATIDNKFTEGDLSNGIPATVISADWLNSVQEEMVKIIEQAGIALNKNNLTQLYTALVALFIMKSQLSTNTNLGTSDTLVPSQKAVKTYADTKLTAASYTAADILAKLLTVDGSSSGLDADLLDGAQKSTSGTLSGNSDNNIPTEKAVKTYADTKLAKKTNLTDIDDTAIANDHIPIFDLTNKKIKTSSKKFSTDGTLSTNSDNNIPTEKAVKTYADTKIAALVNSSPATLDTLAEIATALGNDPNFATTITNLIGTKLNSSAYTASDVLSKIKTVDGSNSGLDADLLDGAHKSTDGTLAGNSDSNIPTQKAVKTYADAIANAKIEKSQNLNDVPDKAAARTNLDVYSKSEVYTKGEIDSRAVLGYAVLTGTVATSTVYLEYPEGFNINNCIMVAMMSNGTSFYPLKDWVISLNTDNISVYAGSGAYDFKNYSYKILLQRYA